MTDERSPEEAPCFVWGFALDGRGGVLPPDWAADGRQNWLHIDYSEPGSEQWLQRQGVPETVVDSLVREDTRPRSMVLAEGILIILRTVNVNPGENPHDMVSLRIWLETDRIITVRQRKVYSTQDLKGALERGAGPRNIQELIGTLVERIVDRIADYVEIIEETLISHEVATDGDEPEILRGHVSALRREVAGVRRYLAPQRDALEALARQSRNFLDPEHAYVMHEQADRLYRYVEDLDLMRERCLVLQEELMNKVAQQQNARMYVLSIVAVIFLPISFVTGVFGMNVAGLPGIEEPRAFMFVVLFMGTVTAGTLVILRLKRWL